MAFAEMALFRISSDPLNASTQQFQTLTGIFRHSHHPPTCPYLFRPFQKFDIGNLTLAQPVNRGYGNFRFKAVK